MAVIDADTHVVECEQTWSYMDKADDHLWPKIVAVSEPVTHKRESPTGGYDFWLVDGRMYMKGGQKSPRYPDGTRDLTDPDVRIAHMDELGIDTQILIPSFFLGSIIEHADAELAVAKSYNRWMADVCHSRTDRLRWVVIGTDYGHADTSTELEAHRLILGRTDLPSGAAQHMADDNARALYGL